MLLNSRISREEREEFQRDDGRTAKEEFDDRGVRERVTRDRLDVLKFVPQLLAAEPLERRVGHDSPDLAIDRNQPWNTGAGHAVGNAAQRRRSGRLHQAKDVSAAPVRHDASSSTVISTPAMRWSSSTMVSCDCVRALISRMRSNTSASISANCASSISPLSSFSLRLEQPLALPLGIVEFLVGDRRDLVEDEVNAVDEQSVEQKHQTRSSFSLMLTKLYGGHGPVYLNVSLSCSAAIDFTRESNAAS